MRVRRDIELGSDHGRVRSIEQHLWRLGSELRARRHADAVELPSSPVEDLVSQWRPNRLLSVPCVGGQWDSDRGGIRITRGEVELAVLGSREGFGEMAILDQGTRSASATAAEETTLLRIDQGSFDRLVELNPAVARGIYRVLTQRLRNTLAQVAAG